MYVYQKHFSVQEVRELIPVLKPLLQEIRELSDNLKEIGFDIFMARYKPGFHPGTLDEFPEDFRRMLGLLHQINDQGIEIKGIEHGLLDFPALRPNGDEVFLCWKIDEDDVEFWHTLNGGFKAREHIDTF